MLGFSRLTAPPWKINSAFDRLQEEIASMFKERGVLVLDAKERFDAMERDKSRGYEDSYHARPTDDNVRLFADMYEDAVDAILSASVTTTYRQYLCDIHQ